MSPGSSTESYPAFARIGLRENPGKKPQPDPTIRIERDLNQAHQVEQEKRAIYEPCIPYLSAKYNIPLFI
ncbi:hypothetical protein ANN_17995 [Periplaneta americana]|uniref:Uncharacterized protein n=1 Tax=Periplaneta americana TaxID=6978 RepID=A0ABQ8SNS5_PERAM|nr:hypothetical protein ANN_17995 [Periplaneta americana]